MCGVMMPGVQLSMHQANMHKAQLDEGLLTEEEGQQRDVVEGRLVVPRRTALRTRLKQPVEITHSFSDVHLHDTFT